MEADRSVVVAQAHRTCDLMSRTIRIFQGAEPGQPEWFERVAQTHAAFEELLVDRSSVTIEVRADAFLYEGSPVLEEPEPSVSLPFALHRDGLRRLILNQGIKVEEMNALLSVFGYALQGADSVCGLWRLGLEHVQYAVEDRTEIPDFGDLDGDGQIQDAIGNVMAQVMGPQILESDDTPVPLDQITPELHPAIRLPQPPTYLDEIHAEIAEEGEVAISIRGLDGTLRALSEHLPEHEVMGLGDALLRMLDSALHNHELGIAARIVRGVRGARQTRSFIGWWLEEATKPARLHHVKTVCCDDTKTELHDLVIDLFRAFGPWVVVPILDLIPQAVPALRRRLANVVTEIGIADLNPVRDMLRSDRSELHQEAVYLLSRTATREAWELLEEIRNHQNPQVRAALAEHTEHMPRDHAHEVASHLLTDPDAKVQAQAVRALARLGGPGVLSILERIAQQTDLDAKPREFKEAALESYGQIGQEQAVPLLTELIERGDDYLTGREVEETALAAAWSLAYVRTVTAVEALKEAAQSRNRRLKDTAKRALHFMKGNV